MESVIAYYIILLGVHASLQDCTGSKDHMR